MARLLFSAPNRSIQSHPSILVSRSNYGPMVDIFRDFLDSSHCTSLEMAWHPAVAEGESDLLVRNHRPQWPSQNLCIRLQTSIVEEVES